MLIGKQCGIYQCLGIIMNHVYWQIIGVFTNVIDNIMNHVYWQTRVVFPMPLIIV